MIAREERRLRALFVSLASFGAAGAGVAGCSTADMPPSDDGADGSVDAPTAAPDAGRDATLPARDAAPPLVDAAPDTACAPAFLDGADDGNGCDYFESLACGLPADSSTLDCYLYLPECATLCGSPFGYPCLVVGCADGAIAAGPLMLECTTGKVSCPDGGRRPSGLRDARGAATSVLGEWLAQAAWMEGASVRAFRRLARELASLGAPAPLVRCAERAAWDEVRHARVMGRLARRRGARPARVTVARPRARSRFEVARENAVEGCVRETFAALAATIQAERAPDPDVARALRRIARDETRHAAIAWSVAAWLHPRLDGEARARVRSAMRDAVAALRCEVNAIPPALTEATGLPRGPSGARLVDALARALDLA